MEYGNVAEAVFLERLNRFVARVLLGGKETLVHVPNTGRCREIFVPGRRVFLTRSQNEKRKYAHTLTGAYKGETLINIDSAAANLVAAEALAARRLRGLEAAADPRRETVFGRSRFDLSFYLRDRRVFMEVKGVTLERDGRALFPDAPTERGARHLRELAEAKAAGYGACLLFILQMRGPTVFLPYEERDPAFAAALRQARKAGVAVLAYDTVVTPAGMVLGREIPVQIERPPLG